MAQLFGQTEAPMMVSMLPPAEHFNADGTVATQRLASAGRPAPLVTGRDHGPRERRRCSPTGERGEIVVRGSLVMAGYYKNPEATEAASSYGWHHTGDIGYLDDDGYLFIVDRLKDMIITGGFNVYSAEVEQALMQHPAVRDCAVVGLPDDKWGERVTAVIEPSADGRARRADRVREGADRVREGAQAGRALAGAAALARRQGAQGGRPHRVVGRTRSTHPLSAAPSCSDAHDRRAARASSAASTSRSLAPARQIEYVRRWRRIARPGLCAPM